MNEAAPPSPEPASDTMQFMDDLLSNYDADVDASPAPVVEEPVEVKSQQPTVTPPAASASPSPQAPVQAAPQPQPAQAVTPPAVQAPAQGQPQVTPPVVQQGAPAAPVTPPVVQPTATPQQVPPAPQGQPQPQAQPAVPDNPLQQLSQAMEQQRETFVKAAAQSYINTFSDEDINGLQTGEPAAAKQVVATMAARLHADIVQNVLGIVAQQVPLMVTRAQAVFQQQRQATDDFYSQYPDLKAHEAAVTQLAAGMRQAYPHMPKEQFIPMLVASARTYAGVQPQAAPVPPVHQQQPQVQRQPAFQPAPARPAPSGGAFGVPQANANGNQWEVIDRIVEAEQAGRFESR